MKTIYDENRDNQNSVTEHHLDSSKPKTSKLKRKKLASAQLSMNNADDSKEEKESRRKISGKQIISLKKDLLEQKYQELHQLLVLPLVQPMNKEVSSDHTIETIEANDNEDFHDASKQMKRFKVLNRSHKPLQRAQTSMESSNEEGYSQWVRRNKTKNNSTTAEQAIDKQNQVKKHIFQPSDTFLRNTASPSIKQWLKRKERELRKKKREERKQIKEERLKKQEQEILKQEKFKDSEQKVREWMLQKRKEAVYRTKQSNGTEKEDSNCDTAKNANDGTDADSTWLKGTDTQGMTNVNILLTKQSRQPTPTSFVYARPVSGRVRLIKLQQENKENAKKKDLEKQFLKKQLEIEKGKKMRVSYDQWLLKKREDDYSKRQEAARIRAKSDSELHHIGVKDAQKRINNFMRQQKINTKDIELAINDSSSAEEYKNKQIKVLGSKKNLNARPSSARPSLSPRISRSFLRPLSANPSTKTSEKENAEKINFKIPYPPEKGAPKFVLNKQRKLFSPHLTKSSVSDVDINSKVASTSSDELITSNDLHDNVIPIIDTNNKGHPVVDMHDKLRDTSDSRKSSDASLIRGKLGVSVHRQKQPSHLDDHDLFITRSREEHMVERKDDQTPIEIKNQKVNFIEDMSSAEQESEIEIENIHSNSAMETKQETQLYILEQIINSDSSNDKNIIVQGQTDTFKVKEALDNLSVVEFEEDSDIPADYVVSKSNLIKDEPTENKSEEDSLTHLEDVPNSKNSEKHVSFQENPVVYESSDTEINSESSETTEIDEDLPEENDEF
ncbi:myosin-2 heavy chain-like isoform X3 [Biomphalaria pfeifferi]|uniref:Myosin-2 heavy chain-like isoform X3 n=1 Tax=Biomphalaria pfeifferi TaxID=112525 RepID=A0AAD8C9F0_BIOPF|nr:myosin-2 heavy chain-like isoform X3 [Biomphalaria pfeifferi]